MELGNTISEKKEKKKYGGKRKKMREREAAEQACQYSALKAARGLDVNSATMEHYNCSFATASAGDCQPGIFPYADATRFFHGHNSPYSYANADANSHAQTHSNNPPFEQVQRPPGNHAPIDNSLNRHIPPSRGFGNELGRGMVHSLNTPDRSAQFRIEASHQEIQFDQLPHIDAARPEINVPLPDRSGTISVDALMRIADLNIKQKPPQEQHSNQEPVLDGQVYPNIASVPDNSTATECQSQKKTAYKGKRLKNGNHSPESPGIGRHSLRSHALSSHMHSSIGSNVDGRVGPHPAFTSHSQNSQYDPVGTGFGQPGLDPQAQSQYPIASFHFPPTTHVAFQAPFPYGNFSFGTWAPLESAQPTWQELSANQGQSSSHEPSQEPRSRSHGDRHRHDRNGSPAIAGPVPKPTLEYLLQASQTSVRVAWPQNVLIILDLNGTLVYRKKRANPASIIPRPDVEAFLDYLFSRFSVMVWSSATPTSVDAMCTKLFSESQRLSLVAEWARNMLGLTAREYTEKVQVYKRLETVWNSPQVAPSHPGYRDGGRWNQSNTILLDDSVLKASAQPHNQIVVPEFVATKAQEKEEIFKQVVEYLEEVVYQKDVSCYMREHPFKMYGDRDIPGGGVCLE